MADLPEFRVDRRWLSGMEEMTTDAHERLMHAIGRMNRELDNDVALLAHTGVDFDRMSIMTVNGDPGRRALLVDGKKVREYVITFATEPRQPQALDRFETCWLHYSEMPEHTRKFADALVEWTQAEYTLTGKLAPMTFNTLGGMVEVKRRG